MLFAFAAALFAISAAAAPCVARSGTGVSALVELYRSQGCPRCPGAEQWLSALAPRPNLIAVAITAEEPGSSRESALRQRRLTPLQRLALVSMPQVLLQGRTFPGWDKPAFDEALAKIAAAPATAWLDLEIVSTDREHLRVRVAAGTASRGQDDARLYLAAFGREAPGSPLRVQQWQGPLLPLAGAPQERVLAVVPGVSGTLSGVVAFLQKRREPEVLQALMLPSCP
jgi:hypothetical protein